MGKFDYLKKYPPAPKRNLAPLRALMDERKVTRWEDFPLGTQDAYLAIAACYPGLQVYACGSRVKGYYADEGDIRAQHIRSALGKRKLVSDFDFIAPRGATPVKPLPPRTDISGVHPMEGSVIPVPIAPLP